MQDRTDIVCHWFDPFGSVSFDDMCVYPNTTWPEKISKRFIFWDQEPLHLEFALDFFNKFENLYHHESAERIIITSETNSGNLELIKNTYGYKSKYYFFHGWAALDWYRGYNYSFLINRARNRSPTNTFISPNRIVAGKRDHRVLFLYHIFKQGLQHNHISAPKICPVQNVDITFLAKTYTNVYDDIVQIFEKANLPKLFAGEITQNMTSCWLTNFNESADSLIYVPTETVYFGHRAHLTEKTFKAIALEMPFVLVAPSGSLEYLRGYGFKTFAGIFDESYDTETDDISRMEKVIALLKDLDSVTIKERQQIQKACLPIVEHNYNHFYYGEFSKILWKELTTLLADLHV